MPRRAYPSDLADAAWAFLEPLIPAPKPGGRPPIHERRELVDAMLSVLRTGCQWRHLPHDLPPWGTVWGWFRRWRDDGTWETITAALRERARVRRGREATPSAAILDSQSANTTGRGGRAATTAARRCAGARAASWSQPPPRRPASGCRRAGGWWSGPFVPLSTQALTKQRSTIDRIEHHVRLVRLGAEPTWFKRPGKAGTLVRA
jgi:transposase